MKKVKREMRSDRANAFVVEPETGQGPTPDDLAEYLGESFLSSATGGDDSGEVLQNELTIDELGGPFIETDASVEMASDANEPGELEAFPTAVRSERISPTIRRRNH